MELNYVVEKMLRMRIHIVVIVITALFLRLYKFKQGEVLMTSDEVYLLEYSMKPVYGVLSGSFEEFVTQLFRFFNFGWGWGTLAGSAVNVFLLTIFNIPITEFTINFPYILVGIVSIIMFYFSTLTLTRNKVAAFICSFILAILPFHVSMSRSIAGFAVSSSLLFFWTLYLFLSYFQLNKAKEKWCGGKELFLGMFSLGIYFCTDNQSPGILPIIFVGGLIFSQEKSVLAWLKNMLRPFFSKFILLFFLATLPTLSGTIYLLIKGLPQGSYILNLFHSKEISFNNNVIYFMGEVYNNVGPILLALFSIAFFYNVYAIIKKNKYRKERIFVLFWFIVTAIPWLFLLSPAQVWFRIYIMQPMAALIVLTTLLFVDAYMAVSRFVSKRVLVSVSVLILLLISFFTLVSTSNFVYGTYYFSWDSVPLYGSVQQNNGIKSAGYYVRGNVAPKSVIFSGVELFNAQYYFGSAFRIVGDLDLSDEKIRDLYVSASKNENVGYVFLTKQQYGIFTKILQKDKFSKEVIFSEYGVERSALFSGKSKAVKVVVIEETDELFNKKYGSLEHLYIDFG